MALWWGTPKVLHHAVRATRQTNSFIITVRVTEGNLTFQWPNRTGTRNALIAWGDGTSETSTGDLSAHTYPAAGDYDIRVSGTYTAPAFNNDGDKLKLINIKQWGRVAGMTNWSGAFSGCGNMTSSATDAPTLVGDSSNMFSWCTKFNSPIGHWSMSAVTSTTSMFQSASAFNQNIDAWDVSNVNSMSSMFYNAVAFNSPLNSWNTANVTDFLRFLRGATAFNQPLSNWNTQAATNMTDMLMQMPAFNQDISGWNTANVVTMDRMFYEDAAFNQNIGNWDTSKVTNMTSMFQLAPAFNQDLSGWCVTLIPTEPADFGNAGTDPIWGTCPGA